ncbi:MAG: S-adenosylmethionine:tRNA ribosyltransferase-isomerase, partial [Myxococcota bacterium]
MQLSRFQYHLPDALIAQHPPAQREDARVMTMDRDTGETSTGKTAASLLDQVRPGDCWVINDTRVRPARVLTQKPTGGRVELLVLSARGARAEAMYRSSKPLKPGQTLHCVDSGDV